VLSICSLINYRRLIPRSRVVDTPVYPQLTKNFSSFMENEGLKPCSQQSANSPYLKPVELCPHCHTMSSVLVYLLQFYVHFYPSAHVPRSACPDLFDLIIVLIVNGRFRWPCGLGHRSWSLVCWDRWIESRSGHGFYILCFCVVLSCVGKGLCEGLITLPKESYRMSK
jgi:hypothetical protein